MAENKPSAVRIEDNAGEATLMSRLVREELVRQNRGSPIGQLLNRWFVILPLFLLVMGILVWTFWPPSAERFTSKARC